MNHPRVERIEPAVNGEALLDRAKPVLACDVDVKLGLRSCREPAGEVAWHPAAAGNSCGGLLALKVAQDARIKSVLLENSGIIPAGATNAGLGELTKNDLAKLHTPVLYVLGGADDIAQPNGMDDFERINHLPVFVADRKNAGHFGVFIEPNGRGTEIEIDWLKWQFDGDAVAKRTFVGEDCRLCNEPGWTVHRKGIK